MDPQKKNGLIKVVTGVRRCGKSYLLFHLFHDHLLENGVPEDHIIEVALDDRRNKNLRDPDAMLQFIDETIKDKEDYYIILDEVQYLNEFEDILNSLLHVRNADVHPMPEPRILPYSIGGEMNWRFPVFNALPPRVGREIQTQSHK
ncbi:MAG: AAA family ATPase [Anaerovoracaceae bacterium]